MSTMSEAATVIRELVDAGDLRQSTVSDPQGSPFAERFHPSYRCKWCGDCLTEVRQIIRTALAHARELLRQIEGEEER